MAILKSMIRLAKSLLPERLKHHLKLVLHIPNMESSLLNMKRNGFSPKVVIDVGAYSGNWTYMIKRIFPSAHVLMLEPQSAKRESLERVVTECNGVDLAPVLVGPSEQESVEFHGVGSASSILPEVEKNDSPSVYLPMTTLDVVTTNTRFTHPDFIKLDVQGYELRVLEGAAGVLESAEAVLMEVNLIEIYKGVPLFHEVVGFMAERGFHVYDICTFFHRPYDEALWQMDVIFVRTSSPLVSSKRWS